MAVTIEQAWRDVGEKFSSWGHRVGTRYRDAGAATAVSAEDTEREMRRVAREVVDELARGFTTLESTLRDEQARRELGAAFTALGEAITVTVNDASRAVRSGGAEGGAPPASPPGTGDDSTAGS